MICSITLDQWIGVQDVWDAAVGDSESTPFDKALANLSDQEQEITGKSSAHGARVEI